METQEARIKRMQMRSMRRGIKEMDLILSDFAGRHLAGMTEAELVTYDALLSENDHDIYGWITGQAEAPVPFQGMIGRIIAGAQGLTRDR